MTKSAESEAVSSTAKPAATVSASLTRSVFHSFFTFYFSRPIKLFRPSAVGSWATLQALARSRGERSVSWTFLHQAWSTDRWMLVTRHILPSLFLNTLSGVVLFGTFSGTEMMINIPTRFGADPLLSPVASSALAGGLAGLAQCSIAIPIENIRQVVKNSSGLTPTPLGHTKAAATPFMTSALEPAIADLTSVSPSIKATRPLSFADAAQHVFHPIRDSPRTWRAIPGHFWTRVRDVQHGWAGAAWVVPRDMLGFSVFFTIFASSRTLAADISKASSFIRARPKLSKSLQAMTIVSAGSLASIAFETVTRPFNVARAAYTNTATKAMSGRTWWLRTRLLTSNLICALRPVPRAATASWKQTMLNAIVRPTTDSRQMGR